MHIHLVDVKSRHQWILQESAGMWTPRWSPDGRSIVALTSDGKELLLYDTHAGQWLSLAGFSFIDSPAWTADSKQIYFRTMDENGNSLLQRIDVRTGRVTPVADLRDLPGYDTSWFGLTRFSFSAAALLNVDTESCTRPIK